MPKIKFAGLPKPIWEHLLSRVAERQVKHSDLHRLREWAASEPSAPDGDWYKDFGTFILCGTGELPKTVLTKGMAPFGDPID